jgi:hypothetical protein
MTANVYAIFARVVADIAVFCESTNADLLNEDIAVGVMEQLAFRLADLNDADKAKLAIQLEKVSFEYSEKKHADFVQGLPEALGFI